MSKTRILLPIAGLLVLLIGIGIAWYAGLDSDDDAEASTPVPLVEAVSPEPTGKIPYIVQTGFVRAGRSLVVSPQVAGRIASVAPAFRVGQRVNAGENLVQLDKERFEVTLAQAKAQLEQARAELDTAQKDLNRQKKLVDQGFVSPASLDQTEAALARAAAQKQVAQAAVADAQRVITDSTVPAPFDAVVAAETATQGALVQVGQNLGELASIDYASIELGLSAEQFDKVGGAQLLQAEVQVIPENQPAQIVSGKVVAISPQMSEQTRTIEVEVRIDRPFEGASPLVLNTLAQVRMPARRYKGKLFSLPLQALQSGRKLWLVNPDDTLSQLNAEIVHQTDDRVLIVSDSLDDRDRVLITPIQNPLDGLPVRLAESPEQIVRR